MTRKEQKIVFHVGAPGTCEHILQEMFFSHLYDFDGGEIQYAKTGRPSKLKSHHNLGRSLMRLNFPERATRRLNRLRKELTDTQADVLVVSDANLAGMHPVLLKNTIETVFEPSEYMIVRFYTNHLNNFMSQYMRNLFGSYAQAEPLSFMKAQLENGVLAIGIESLRLWQEAFGGGLRFIKLEGSETSDELADAFFSTICAGTGITAKSTGAATQIFGTKAAYVEAARILMSAFSEFPGAPAAAAGFYAHSMLAGLNLPEYDASPAFTLTHEEAAFLRGSCQDEARELDMFFGDSFFSDSLERTCRYASEGRSDYLNQENRRFLSVLSKGMLGHFRPPVMKFFE